MELLTTTSLALLVIAVAVPSLILLLQQPTSLVKWIERKNYQYEVTFALYMLTPTEKFVLNSIFFLTAALLLIASTLYLPDHVATMARRTYYYCLGGDGALLLSSSRHAAETLYGTATRAGDAVIDAATGWAHTAYLAAWNRTAASVAGGQALDT